ncbi:MAG TPA: hypothetical protein VIW03_04715 [Anaeromyxobacter sp.]
MDQRSFLAPVRIGHVAPFRAQVNAVFATPPLLAGTEEEKRCEREARVRRDARLAPRAALREGR